MALTGVQAAPKTQWRDRLKSSDRAASRPTGLEQARDKWGGELRASMPTSEVRTIIHPRRIAAASAERGYYATHVEVLEPDHPE